MLPALSKRNYSWLAIAIGAAVLPLANFSLLFGWLNTPPGTRFLGLRLLLPADTPVYYSYLRQVQDGGWTLRDLYTAEAQPMGTFNILWLALGLAGRALRFSPSVTFHVSRVLLGGFLLYTLAFAAAQFLRSRVERFMAWLLMLSGGVGWLLVPWLPAAEYLERGAGYRFPVDLWLPWGYPMLALGQSPHLVASWLLQVLTVVLTFLAIQQRRWNLSLLAGLAAAIWINFHPYHWPGVLLIPAVWFVLRWLRTSRPPLETLPWLFPLLVGTAGSLAYHWWVFRSSPLLAARAIQNISRLPNWPYVVAGLGIVLPLALAGAWRQRRHLGFAGEWLLAWVIAAAVLIIFPTQFQARYLQGILVPLSLLATLPVVQGGVWLWRRGHRRWIFAGGFVLAVLAYGSPFTLAWRDVAAYRRAPERFYFPQTFFAAADFLRRTVPPGVPILAAHDSGLFLPAFAGRTVYFGHGDETVASAEKRAVVERFYTTPDPAERQEILKRIGVHYVWYGWFERQLGGPDLLRAPGSVSVFSNEHVAVLWFE